MSYPKNKILTDDAHQSRNFYRSDTLLRCYISKHFSDTALNYMGDKLDRLGSQAATQMDELSQTADRESPKLNKRNRLGETINKVEFHPAYWKLMDIAAKSEMFYAKYTPELREKFTGERHKLGFAAGQLYAMSELGAYCPLCMTDGAAYLVERYASEKIRKRLLPKLAARTGDELYSGAMFLTEKSGGSDVGRNLAAAEQVDDVTYKLNGEKWFCSNVNADVIMALARTGAVEDGTRGLSLFLVEKELPDGFRNPMNLIRLKEKLGVRSMATGEVEFKETIGIRLGEENSGFKVMTEMINISRLYNSVAAVGGMRRALIEAWQYLNHRIIFDKKATEHALIRQKFHELGSRYVGAFLLVWRAIRAMDAAEEGRKEAKHLMRILIPMAKWHSAEQSVYLVRECMELMGGNGYIEDFVIPKLLRDVNVLPIWEGSGNIIVLDMLRAMEKSNGLELVIEQIREAPYPEGYGNRAAKELDSLLSIRKKLDTEHRDTIEATAKPLFEKLINLYQMALMAEERDKQSESWIDPSMEYLSSKDRKDIAIQQPPGLDLLDGLLGWEF